MNKKEDKVVLVTGATSGIGKEIALQLANHLSTVCINYSKNDADAESVAGVIRQLGTKVVSIKADVSCESEVKLMFDKINSEFGKLDYLINNAGIDIPQPLENYDTQDWNSILQVNLTGKFLCIKYAVSLLKKSNDPRIINIASRSGFKPRQELSAYCCSQAGILMLTKVAALELAKYKIKANAVSPGFTKTPLTERLDTDKAIWDNEKKINPSGRIGMPVDIANVVNFLISNEAEYLNGVNISVDGGSSLL